MRLARIVCSGTVPTSGPLPIAMDFSDQTVVELQHLLNQVNTGNEIAFNEIVLRAEGRLRQLVHRMLMRFPHVKRWEQTDDVYQRALIRLHRSLQATKPESVRNLFGLTATQIRRTLIDMARHHYGAYGRGTRHHSDGGGRAADDPGGALERVSHSRERVSIDDWTDFHAATQKLPVEEQEVFNLAWYTGLEQKEIAKMLDISVRTVIRRLNRARLLLKDLLANSEAEKSTVSNQKMQ